MLESLLKQQVIDRKGKQRTITVEDVLVVAPYNMQVNRLRSVLPDGAHIGTVDKFQGQEAEVVIVSMATSGADSMPRDAACKVDQVFSARAEGTSQPVLDRPRAGSRPALNGLYSLVGAAQLSFQRGGYQFSKAYLRPRHVPTLVQLLARFRQHFSSPPSVKEDPGGNGRSAFRLPHAGTLGAKRRPGAVQPWGARTGSTTPATSWSASGRG